MELLDLYTKDRINTGRTIVRGEKVPEGFYKVVIHVCIFNSKGQMLIQQRQPFKKGWSNLWDISLGGHVSSGDTSQSAAERELKEELGLSMSFENISPTLTAAFAGNFDDIYLIEKDVELSALKLQPEEVQAVKWAELEEILEMIENGSFIPYHKSFLGLLFSMQRYKDLHFRKDSRKVL